MPLSVSDDETNMALLPSSNVERIMAILAGFDSSNSAQAVAVILARIGVGRTTGFALIRHLLKASLLVRVDQGWVKLGPGAKALMFSPLGIRFQGRAFSTQSTAPESHEALTAIEPGEWSQDLLESVVTDAFVKKPPYKIGFSNASMSNAWRVALVCNTLYAANLHSAEIASLEVKHAEDSAVQQVQQIDELIASGIDILLVSPAQSDDEALAKQLRAAIEQGIAVVAVDRRPVDPQAFISFVTASDSTIGRSSALWLAEHLKGRGRVWMMSGPEQASPAMKRQSAALEVFARYPDIHLEAVINSQWQESAGREQVTRLLEDKLQVPDGVWCDSGLQGVGSIEAFVEYRRGVPAHTGGDLNKMYKLAIHHKIPFFAADYPAAMGSRAIEIALSIVAGKVVPKRLEVALNFVAARHCETVSIKADEWAERHVRWDLPDDVVLSQGPSLKIYNDKALCEVLKGGDIHWPLSEVMS